MKLLFLRGYRSWGGLRKLLKPAPVYASIKLTDICNSRCITCNIGSGTHDHDELGQEGVFDLLADLRRCGVRCIRFTGGEPLLYRSIEPVLEYARRLGFRRIQVATNGLLLEQKAEQLRDATHVTVSLDGIGETNDTIRGIPGDFNLSIRGIERLKSACPNIEIEIATTLLPHNLREIDDLLALCRQKGLSWFVNLFDTRLYFFTGISAHTFAFTNPAAIAAAHAQMHEAIDTDPSLFSFRKVHIDYICRYLEQHTFPAYCILGFTTIDIAANGDIYSGCWAMEPMGTIRDDSLPDLLASDRYRRRAFAMYRRQCPQCTCGWMINYLYERW